MTEVDDPLTVHDHVVRCTYACIARFGMSKTTVEDVVKETGLSRATIYRYFPGGREELLHEAVAWQVAVFLSRLADHVAPAESLAEMLDKGLEFARQAVVHHELLQRLLQTEPERLVGLLSTESAKTAPFIAAFLVPRLEIERKAGRVGPDVDLAGAAAHLSRLILSYIGAKSVVDLDDAEQRRDLVERELLGWLHP